MIALNHAFVHGIARRAPADTVAALKLVEHTRRRTGALPRVHPDLATTDTGEGPLIQWANHVRRDPAHAALVELLLRMTGGPFLTDDRFAGHVEPVLVGLADCLADTVLALLAVPAEALCGLVSPSPTGGADADAWTGGGRVVPNWRDASGVDAEITARATGTTLDVLLEAERRMDGRLVVLPSARRSADVWALDCTAVDLLCALLGLDEYRAALVEGLPREQAASRYHQHTGIPMSQESGDVWRRPARRREREFETPGHGTPYFDMHAKPGNLTRIYIWLADDRKHIYVGHCGRHPS